jgi:hypothetical protein
MAPAKAETADMAPCRAQPARPVPARAVDVMADETKAQVALALQPRADPVEAAPTNSLSTLEATDAVLDAAILPERNV